MSRSSRRSESPAASLAVINYKGREYLEDLFESLRAQSRRDFEILFIDNDSGDGSLELVQSRYPEAITMPQPSNLGFARAGNLAARSAKADFLALLNADIKLAPDWLERMLSAAADPSTAAVACKMLLSGRPGKLNGVGGVMNRLGYTWDRGMFEEDRGQYDDVAETFFASAGAALFRRRDFIEVGGFDERFFMYHEDVDLCWRLWLWGRRVVVEPRAVAFHHFGGSTGKAKGMAWRELLGERNSIRSLIKNYEWPSLLRSVKDLCLLRQSPRRKWGQMRNLGWNLIRLPDTLRCRRGIQKRRRLSDAELKNLIVQSPNVPFRL